MERSKLHMSNQKRIVPNKKYDQRDSLKPNGLWYSFGCEWISWCFSEMKDRIGNYSHEIEVQYEDILVLETSQDVVNFQKNYGKEERYLGCPKSSYTQINWNKLSEDFSGIEIRNYSDIYRSIDPETPISRSLWISSWDVSAGCVWDLSKIKVKTRHETQKIMEEDRLKKEETTYEFFLQNL
jgi:hypothetical protein